MRNSAFQRILLTGFAVAWLSGCGGGDSDKLPARVKVPEGEAEISKEEIKRYDIADLEPVDEPLQRPLDGGRLELCPPAEWGFFSQANYLVVFAKGRVSELPRMTVAAADSPFGADDTTKDNAHALATKIQQKLVKDKRNIREKPKPVILGDRVWIRSVRQVTQGGTPCAVQSLQIVRGGRLYMLEMFSAAKDDSPASMAAAIKADKARDIAYAVAANAKFPKAAESTSPVPEEKKPEKSPTEEKPAEKPAEAKPEEKKTV
jgi:hypothetical protein